MQNDVLELLRRNEKQLINTWLTKQATLPGPAQQPELHRQSEELVHLLLQALADQNAAQAAAPDLSAVLDLLADISAGRARQGFTIRDTGQYIMGLKDAILALMQAEFSTDYQLIYTEIIFLGQLFDQFTLVAFETFMVGREAIITRQTNEIAEVSTPVIQVWEGILVLPIIGTLDSSRTQTLMENLLQNIVDTGCGLAILDISGVPAVDSLVAQNLIKTVNATRLMGAECIISGIRPEIAQTVVHLGIDLSQMVTKATLASALKHAFSVLQLDVRRIGKAKPTLLIP